MRKINIIILSLIFSLSTASLLLGAPPGIGDALRQSGPPKDLPQKEVKSPFVSEKKDQELVKKLDEGKKVFIKRFFITGAVHMSSEELRAILAPFEEKELSFGEMEYIVSLLTKAYREAGYFVAKAYLPKQDLFTQDGALKINIIEGKYGDFKVTNSSLVSNERVQAGLYAVKEDGIVSAKTLERAVLILNDTPGVKVTAAEIKPGREIGTSDFDITTEATNPYSAYIVGDNYGSKYTGIYRTHIGLSANSPLGYGDKFGINGLISTKTDLKNGKIYYNYPLTDTGLRGEVSVAKTSYTLGDAYASLDALGTAIIVEASLFYPFIRTEIETLNLSFALAHKDLKDEILNLVTKKEAVVGTLGIQYIKDSFLFGLKSKTTSDLDISYGKLDDSDSLNDGIYAKISGSVEHYLQFNRMYTLNTSLRFQKALKNNNLEGSEDFSIGGAYGVRAFPQDELSAENGYILGMELIRVLPSIAGINHKVSIFADTGYATMEKDNPNFKSRTLSDVGLGYHALYQDFFAKAQVARVVGGEKVTSEPEYSTKLLVQVGWVF